MDSRIARHQPKYNCHKAHKVRPSSRGLSCSVAPIVLPTFFLVAPLKMVQEPKGSNSFLSRVTEQLKDFVFCTGLWMGGLFSGMSFWVPSTANFYRFFSGGGFLVTKKNEREQVGSLILTSTGGPRRFLNQKASRSQELLSGCQSSCCKNNNSIPLRQLEPLFGCKKHEGSSKLTICQFEQPSDRKDHPHSDSSGTVVSGQKVHV